MAKVRQQPVRRRMSEASRKLSLMFRQPEGVMRVDLRRSRQSEIGQLLPVVRGSRRPDALQGRAIATIRVPLTLESVLHGAEMSSISDLSEYQAINAFDAYQVVLQWTSKQGKILDCVCFCVLFPLRMIAPQ